MDALNDYPSVRDYLYSLKHQGAKYGIDRMRLLVEALGHPENNFPSIHVAGTNGKGSVSAMLEAVYRKNGYTTGLYTSPHLIRLGERVQVDRVPLDEADIVAFTCKLRPIAEALAKTDPDDHPSFFEFMTAMAFLRFASAEVDLGIIETGLGGRLDASNVVTPELAIITSISLDHVDQLGGTIEKIAAEKSGIIKPGRPVLIGKLPPAAEAVVRGIATERRAKVHAVTDRFPSPELLPRTNLQGSFQRWNAGVALYATEILAKRFSVDPEAAASALQAIHWPGRWERVNLSDRTLILDATHNEEGAAMLDENLKKLVDTNGGKPVIISGTLGEQRARSLIPVVARHAAAIHLIEPKQSRATPTEVLLACIPRDYCGPVYCDDLDELFPEPGRCNAGEVGSTIVVTGSIYLIGEVMERLFADSAQGEGMLQDVP